MTRLRRRLLTTLAAGTVLACGDIAAPVRNDLYEWRIFAPSTTGPGIDTISFHWDRAALPVRIWVENTLDLPAHMTQAIEVWESMFLYREFQGTLVDDSTGADVIVVGSGPPGTKTRSALRLHAALAPQCAGATDLDVNDAHTQLRLPIRIYLDPRSLPDDPVIPDCLALTAIHELGHALGIFAHSPNATDIMFTDPQVALPSRFDQETAEAVYHYPPTIEAVRP